MCAHALAGLRAAGIARRIAVTGRESERVEAAVRAADGECLVVRNPHFREGNLLTLLAALEQTPGGFVVCNVDHLYPRALVRHFIEHSPDEGVLCATDRDRTLGADDMKILLDGGGRVGAISKQLDRWDLGYIGMTRVSERARPAYDAALRRVHVRVGRSANVEAVVGALAEGAVPPAVCDLSGYGWLEIDTPEELAAARAELTRDRAFFARTRRG